LIVLAPDGKIVVGATLPGNNSIGVVRYTAQGALDTTFAGAGYAGIPIMGGATSAVYTLVTLDAAGRIVLGHPHGDPAQHARCRGARRHGGGVRALLAVIAALERRAARPRPSPSEARLRAGPTCYFEARCVAVDDTLERAVSAHSALTRSFPLP